MWRNRLSECGLRAAGRDDPHAAGLPVRIGGMIHLQVRFVCVHKWLCMSTLDGAGQSCWRS